VPDHFPALCKYAQMACLHAPSTWHFEIFNPVESAQAVTFRDVVQS